MRRDAQVEALVGEYLAAEGLVTAADAPIVGPAVELMQGNLELVQDAARELAKYCAYPLAALLSSGDADDVIADNLADVADAVVAAHESGALLEARLLLLLFLVADITSSLKEAWLCCALHGPSAVPARWAKCREAGRSALEPPG